ncbi:hypothetical protein Tco_1381953 [Tanacetum coccineum]
MYVLAFPEHVPAIPDQLPVEPSLAPNPLELNNHYLDAVDYDDEEEPYEDLDDEEEDLEVDPKIDLNEEEEDPEMDLNEKEEDPKMDLDEEEENPKMDVDDEEEEEPLPASPPPLSPLKTPPPLAEFSSDSDIPGMGTHKTEIAEAHKEAIRARRRDRLTLLEQDQMKNREEILRLKNQVHSANISATLAAMDVDRIEKTQDQYGKQIRELRHRLTSTEIRLEVASVDRIMPPKRMSNAAIERMIADRVDAEIAVEQTAADAEAAEVARAAASAETTRAAAIADGAGGSNNARPAVGVGGPNVAGPTVGAIAMNAVPKVKGCLYKEFMSCQPTNFKGIEGAVGLTRWFERSESVFLISKCAENDKVKYVTSTLLDEALSWWNSVAQPIDIENAYKIHLVELKKIMIKQYCPRTMVPTTEKLLEKYVWGLPQLIQGNVTSFDPVTIDEAMRIARRLMDQAV